MNQTVLVVIILLAIAGAVALYVLHRRSSATAKTVSSLGARMDNAATKVENVAAKVAAVPSLVATHIEAALRPKAIPVVGTTAEPAPAAPAASVAIEPPPATVAPAASTAAPAPSAGGSGTEHTLNAGVVAEHARNQYLSLDFTNKLPAGEVQLADAEYIVKMGPPFRAALGTLSNVQLQFAILSGTQAAINLAMDHALQDIARTLKSDPATYAGPLKARYAALVEGVHSGAIKPVSLYSDTGAAS